MANCITCGRTAGFLREVCDTCKEKRSPGSSGKPVIRRHISSIALVHEAALQIYRNRSTLLLAVAIPILCSSVLQIACIAYIRSAENNASRAAIYLLIFARLPFYVMFAAICHRVVLLGDRSLPRRWGLFWSIRETRFLGWIFVFGIITLAVSIPISLLIPRLPYWALEWLLESSPFSIPFYTCVLVSTYFDGRLGIVLPATAVGNPMNPLRSWRFTAGNGWSIFVALIFPVLITEVIDHLLFDLLLDTESMVVNFLSELLYYPLIAIGVVVITVAYRELVLAPEAEARSAIDNKK